jgi:hypothetical protein
MNRLRQVSFPSAALSLLLCLVSLGLLSCQQATEPATAIDLAGEWQIRLDPEAIGIKEAWWESEFSDQVTLPGSITAQGYGDAVGPDTPWVGSIKKEVYADPRYDPYRTKENFKFPFWLEPEKYFRGAAWFQREITIPADWEGKRIVLHLERPHWETEVWVNGRKAGSHDSLSTPHEYDVTEFLKPGSNRLTLRVDNSIRLDVGRNSHSISDHTQGNWNGIVGDIELRATDKIWLEDVRVFPSAAGRHADVKVKLGNLSETTDVKTLVWTLLFEGYVAQEGRQEITWKGKDGECAFHIYLGENAKLWDEFEPNLYQLQVALEPAGDRKEVIFGLRDIGTEGTQFTLNGRKLFFRGTLECAIFPKTGHPPMEVEEWKLIIEICQAHGLNHMRFHSWCPPKAAFVAADELGFYFQVESGSWANFGATVGDGTPLDQWLYREAHRISKHYGNHPSFVLTAYGNEPSGKNMQQFLSEWCEYWKKAEPRALHTSGSGWPLLPESDFHVTHKGTRIQGWGQALKSIINAKPPQTRFDFTRHFEKHGDKPTISHEIGQWCVYPNFEEIKKYTGLLKPRNFEIFREFLDQAGMLDQASDFVMASGKLQALCYKHDIEASLRTRGFGGFQLLDLHDFPGQGTALVGILDPFWDEKGYVTPEEHRRYCSPTVPLARMDQMIWTSNDTLKADIEVANFGPDDLRQAVTQWRLKDSEGDIIQKGAFEARDLPTGQNTEVGKIKVPLSKISAPAKLVLEVAIENSEARNQWDLWCYPARVKDIQVKGLEMTRELDKQALQHLEEGGTVLWMVPAEKVKTDVDLGFSSIFWNTAWTNGQAPHTLGILCDPSHPALKEFPTDFHSNWQWWELIDQAATLEMDHLPQGLRPIVQVVPDWFKPKRLGLLFEAKVGKGKLIVTSMELEKGLDQRPVARQMLFSIKAYIASDRFQPSESVTVGQLEALVKKN